MSNTKYALSILALLAFLILTIIVGTSLTSKTRYYRVVNYNGDVEMIEATAVHADGVAIRFKLPNGTRLWLIDVAEVKEIPQ
jgi:hypothetical protein